MKENIRRIYFAKCIHPLDGRVDFYKVGCSFGYENRMDGLEATSPFKFEIHSVFKGSFFMEKVVHMALREEYVNAEYFHARGKVLEFAKICEDGGSPFPLITDSADEFYYGNEYSLKKFMEYHGVTIQEACDFCGADPLYHARKHKNPNFKSSKILSATALIATAKGHTVNWPIDSGFYGRNGKHPIVKKKTKAKFSSEEFRI